ncbi:MFS multidrug transporter [Pseudohyphozyma bogoriensis]|nr:MFS multidrug transporter [Pseudohyphozyma bogoriensis]
MQPIESPALTEKTSYSDTAESDVAVPSAPPPFRPTRQFWLVFLSLCTSCFLSALDLTAVSTILPSIAADLKSGEYSWVGSSYALTSTAFIPWFGGFAEIFGRRSAMLSSLFLFAVGSAICGAAPTMNVLIVGRSVQGVGGGGILTMVEILAVDLIPLASRGAYLGIIGFVWAVSSAIGPPIGGAFGGDSGLWRYLFYMNLPLAAIAMVLVAIFLDVRVPPTTWSEKFAQMDYANGLFVAGTTAAVLGLTWAGEEYSWGSYHVLAPLILGLAGMVVFMWIEKKWVKHPTVPFDILTNRTSVVGFITNFLHGIASIAAIYYYPVYFQAAKDASPLQSGINLFSASFTIAPFAIIVGISVTITGHYKFQNLFGWAMCAVGFAVSSLLKVESPKAAWAAFPVILGIGLGCLYSGTVFPVTAPLRPDQQPHAMAFHAFTRSFGQVFGISIGATVLNGQLAKLLPAKYLAAFGGSSSAAYASILSIKELPAVLQQEVKVAFVDSLKMVWQVMIGVSCLGFVVAIAMKQLALATTVDENWGLKGGKEEAKTSEESQV